jgi:hypothetical protein
VPHIAAVSIRPKQLGSRAMRRKYGRYSQPPGTRSSKSGMNVRRRYWSGEVTRHSNALDLDSGVFTWSDPQEIAASLKRSAEASERRKGTPFQSAMSMLNFYINRAGTGLSERQRRVLERAKHELRRAFGRA